MLHSLMKFMSVNVEHFGKIDILELPKQNTELKPIYLKNVTCTLKISIILGPYAWGPSITTICNYLLFGDLPKHMTLLSDFGQ